MVYCIVSPDPDMYKYGNVDFNGSSFFYIKIGDADFPVDPNKRYDAHNPSYILQNCTNFAGNSVYAVPGSHAHGVQIGKFLENNFLKVVLGHNKVGETEWYKITAAPGGIDPLREYLIKLLLEFPNINFDAGSKTSDVVAMEWVKDQITKMKAVGN